MRILVAGALGEVGRTVTAEFAELGHEVLPVSARAGEPGVEALALDDAVTSLRAGAVDLVVNMAGRGDRRVTERTGLATTQTLAVAAEAADVSGILISTTRVLEDLTGSFAEDAPPACHTPYALANAENESLWRSSAPGVGSILRITNYFCPPSAFDSPQSKLLPWSLVTEAETTGVVEVRSAPDTFREFVSARDVAAAVLAMSAQPSGPPICATAPGLVMSLADLVSCMQDAFAMTGRARPEATFGSAVSEPSSCMPGWLAGHGWVSTLTPQGVTRVMAEWLSDLHLD